MEQGTESKNEDISVTNFRRYLRINTVQPKPAYGKIVLVTWLLTNRCLSDLAAKFLTTLGEELELNTKIVEVSSFLYVIFNCVWPALAPI